MTDPKPADAQDDQAPVARSVEAEPPEPELSIGHYFGGYAIIFLGAVGLALLLVLVMKLAR